MGEFVNTFQNGMNQDSNVFYQPEGTYRFANNLQLINVDGNNVTLKDSLGNRKIILLDVPFASSLPTYQAEPMSLAFVSFPDGRLVVLHTNNESSIGGGGEIGQMFLTNIGQSVDAENQTILSQTFAGYVPLYYHELLSFSKMYKIEGFGFKENDNISRIYWIDNFNEPRVFNISNPIFTTYITTGSLVATKQYMVVSGVIQHNAIDYGKGLATGNVFTAVNANYTAIAGNILVIEYFPYQLLSWTPSRALGNMHFDTYGTGVKRCGSNVYFYRLGKRSEGYFTTWSYGSTPVHVGVPNTTAYLSGNTYQDFVGDGASTGTPIISAKSVKMVINNIDTNFDIIQLASADYDNLYTTPYSISIVDEETITGSIMTLEDFGNKNLGNLTIDDITLFPASILKCKTLTTDKNYNIIGNITERKELTFDKTNIVISSFEYPLIAHGVDGSEAGASCTNGYVPVNTLLTAQLTANPNATEIRPFSRWLVTLGNNTTDTVTYNAVQYTTGQVITGIVGTTTIVFTGSGAVRPCVNLNKYTPIAGGTRPNAIQLKTGFWDYKDPAVASAVKGYWSHETYRFGILPFDKKGNPMYVHWLGDYQMPEIVTKGGLMRQDLYLATNSWALNPSLITINGIELSQEFVDNISGFSVVRAPRDVRIVTQGLLIQNGITGANNVYPNDGIPTILQTTASNIYQWICPDDLVSLPEKQSIGIKADKMEEACWLDALTWNATSLYRSGNADHDVYAKLFIPKTDVSSGSNLRIATILDWIEINENDSVVNLFGISGYTYINNVTMGAYTTDTTCTSASGNVSMATYFTVGGKKALVYMNGIPHYGQYPSGYDYSVTSVASVPNNPTKLMMNYVKNTTNPYGGIGDTAVANTLYISTGHFQPINATVLAETLSGGKYIFNGVQIGGGDCFTNLIDYGYGLFTAVGTSASIGYYFPCECNSNYGLRRGRKASNKGMGAGVPFPAGLAFNPLRLEDFSYNPAYSTEGAQFQYPALPVNFISSGKFLTRARFAGKKIIGELIDSFRTFLVNDYIDVDVQLGEINNLKAKGDYVYYWQNHAVGSMPILERQMISQGQGSATTLGTGGVLTRFDTISTKFGNQHQWGLTDTEDGWIWFDMRNKDVCIMGFGGAVQEITVPTGMKSFFAQVFLERLTVLYNDTYLNSQIYDASSDRPLMGTGITGVYDPKNKMSYLTFKFRSNYDNTLREKYSDYQIVNKDFTIGFSHINNKFVGFYDKYPAIWHNHGQVVLSNNNPKNLDVYYASDMVCPTPVEIGNVIKVGNVEYVCYKAGNIASYLAVPDPTMFVEINRTNQVFAENEEQPYGNVINGYQYNFLYGRVVNNEGEFIANPKAGQMSVTNYEMGSTGSNITDIEISADDGQIASDSNIKSYNRDYKYFDGSWWANLPLFKGSRITDKYLRFKFTKKNALNGNPTTVDNTKLTVFQYFKSFFEIKK